MKKKPASKSAFFNPRVLISFAFCAIGVLLALLAFALYPGGNALARQNQSAVPALAQDSAPVLEGRLTEEQPSAPTIPITPLVESGKIDATEGSPCSVINGGQNPQALSESGVAAPAGFFWSEVQHDTGNITESNTNAGYADTQGTLRLADNFTLTQPCTH